MAASSLYPLGYPRSTCLQHHARRSEAVLPPLQTICTTHLSDGLQTLHIHLGTSRDTSAALFGANPAVEFSNVFSSLLQLRRLKKLTIHAFYRVLSVSDPDLVQMIRAWPHLTTLMLTYVYHPYNPNEPTRRYPLLAPHPSISAMAAFATSCDHLQLLCLDIASITKSEVAQLEGDVARGALGPQQMLTAFVPSPAGGSLGRTRSALRALLLGPSLTFLGGTRWGRCATYARN